MCRIPKPFEGEVVKSSGNFTWNEFHEYIVLNFLFYFILAGIPQLFFIPFRGHLGLSIEAMLHPTSLDLMT